MAHGYYSAYLEYGLKKGEPLDVGKVEKMSLEKVREVIRKIEGVGFIKLPDRIVRMDVLKEIVKLADEGKYAISQSAVLETPRKGKKKGMRRIEVERLAKEEGITVERIIRKTKHLQPPREKGNPVKHKKAVYDILRKINPNILKNKE